MLDIIDKSGKVVAVIMDDGTVIRKNKVDDDINKMIEAKLVEESRNKFNK